MSKESELWEIYPRTGVGNIKFGMSKFDTAKLSGTYGDILKDSDDRIPDSILEDTLSQFGGELSEEERKALMDVYAKSGPAPTSVTEVRGKHGLVLRYETNRLLEILLSTSHKFANFLGKPVFKLSALDTLILFETANRGPGRYQATEAAFDDIAISLDGFSATNGGGSVRPLGEADERFKGRTIMLRPEPYVAANEMNQFVTHSFLPGAD